MSNKHNRSNYNPEVWGPNGWFFLDTIVLSYPDIPSEKHKKMFFDFFSNIGKMLPCQKCRHNYDIHIQKKPLTMNTLKSRDSLLLWWIDIHNMARMTLDKKHITLDNFIYYYKNCYTLQKKIDYEINYLDTTKKQTDLSIIFYVAFAILLVFILKKIK
jgi:hypothetical protein